ncbi:MAG: hypothetical protein GXP48_12225 [Acidobacteria bacterium]|nr:hypothetical protein [Acidobacteriota bacterium]
MNHALKAVRVGVLAGLMTVAGCNMVNPNRPQAQPDTTVYGTLINVVPDAKRPGTSVVRLTVRAPRELAKEAKVKGRRAPAVEGSVTAEVRVGPDTVVLKRGAPAASLDAFPVGTEMVALPVEGTTRMIGSNRVLCDASYLVDFATYRRWRLPKLEGTPPSPGRDDPARINSAGIEHSPVPLKGGRVLYFAAHLRAPWKAGTSPFGALRKGLPKPGGPLGLAERTYRTELTATGWTPPELVVFPKMDGDAVVRVSWVNEAETLCLVTVKKPGGQMWVGRSVRASASKPWGPIGRLTQLGKGEAEDAVYLAGSTSMIGFSRKFSGKNSDLYLYTPKRKKAMPLDPRINTPSPEWCPRVGPANQLFFCRADRQLEYMKGAVHPARLPGKFRRVLTEANPTRDGRWMFFCLPRYTPVELDQDIYVAPWHTDGSLGEPIAVDQWRPGNE